MGLCFYKSPPPRTRREMLKQSGAGFGGLALNALLSEESIASKLSQA